MIAAGGVGAGSRGIAPSRAGKVLMIVQMLNQANAEAETVGVDDFIVSEALRGQPDAGAVGAG